MRLRILGLSALHLAVAAVLGGIGWAQSGLATPAPLLIAFALGFAVVGSLQMHIELGRHACAVTLVEAVLVGGLFVLGAGGVVCAAVLGEVAACVAQRQRPLQLLYNACAALGSVTLAAMAFRLSPVHDPQRPAAWAAALAAVACYAVANHASTSTVLTMLEGRRFDQVLLASMAPAGVATVVSATIGLVAVVLYGVAPAAPLLVAPLVLLMVLETRRLATHRAEHLRFERLYAASARTGELQGTADVLATLAEEARTLVTGAVAVCCTTERSGTWSGVIVGDGGVTSAAPAAVQAVLALSGRRDVTEITAEEVPAVLREVLPPLSSVVVSRSTEAAAAPVVLAVLRQLSGDDGGSARRDVLDAFIGHAALSVANARLYEDVENALAHQVDLNRQKDDFVAVVSHELRTPLTSMIGSVHTLRRMDDRLTPDRRAVLTDIALRQGHRLQRLIEELLLLATVQQGGRATVDEQVNLRSLVTEITTELRDTRRDAPVDVQFETLGVPLLRTDEQKLRQILTNLVENACKYAPGHPIRVRAEADGEHVVIDVIDRGPGIALGDRERVFERFVQLDQSSTRRQGGTGLGLYLCRQLAALLGGSLELRGDAGGGCCFTLTVPCALLHLDEDPQGVEVLR